MSPSFLGKAKQSYVTGDAAHERMPAAKYSPPHKGEGNHACLILFGSVQKSYAPTLLLKGGNEARPWACVR
jgi:hypothetical protein